MKPMLHWKKSKAEAQHRRVSLWSPSATEIARMAWAIMVRGERYNEPKLLQAA
jgi:hypothetical protein